MNTKAMIDFLRGIENPAPLDLAGDPDHDRQILAAAADRKLQAYQAAFGRHEHSRSRIKDECQFKDPPLYRDFYRLDDGTLLELVSHPDREDRTRFVEWDPSATNATDTPQPEFPAPDSQTKSDAKAGKITYLDHLPIIVSD